MELTTRTANDVTVVEVAGSLDTQTSAKASEEFTEIAPQSGAAPVSLRQLGNARTHSLQLLDETYPPGADTGPELLSHAGEEAGIITEGEIEITVGENIRRLTVGDGYLFDSRQPHRFRNISDKTCRIISACTPPTF